MSETNDPLLIEFEAAELHDLERSLSREWLLTNGFGGYASSSLVGANTRRYHGLLVAAVNPPVQRTILLSKVDEEVTWGNTTYKLGVNEWQDGTIDPQGYQLLERVTLDGTSVEFRYALPGCTLIKKIVMPHGLNAISISYRLESESKEAQVKLLVRPFLCFKDYHQEQRGNMEEYWGFGESGGVFWCYPKDKSGDKSGPAITMMGNIGVGDEEHWRQFKPWKSEYEGYWFWNFYHRAEAERGLDFIEDLYVSHHFTVTLNKGETRSMIWWFGEQDITELSKDWLDVTEHTPAPYSVYEDAPQLRLRKLEKVAEFDKRDDFSRLLFRAADQFVVRRPSVREVLPPDVPDRSVIAGYHWFSDWGRDTMIAFPGLMLTTKRYDEAAGMLRTFAAYLDQGMLPNRFPDSGESPEYNTVDATLWLFQAVFAYYQATNDLQLIAELYPKLAEVVQWHQKGTRYRIKVDPEDGLLRAGETGVQLTWMDAKVEDWVVTPRVGKPVEINALWCNALGIMAELAEALQKPESESSHYRELAAQVRHSFQDNFWYADGEYLYDVIDSEDPHTQYIDEAGRDCSLRPNQLFALSLPFGPFAELDEGLRERAISIIDVCAKSLLTPYGMRTLSPNDLRYIGRFTGGQRERDGAYHQGTVWPWPLGAFVEAHYRIHGDKATAQAFLEPLCEHLKEGSIGSLNEVYDGDPPHRPLGCIAQAWSVSEVLRLWTTLQEQ